MPKTEILTFGSQRVLSVELFDRQMHSSGEWIMRLPQEDFCQVMGVPSHLKYESDGGPGLSDLAGLLKGSIQAEKDLTTQLTTQLLFWMFAAPDGHAKNFSIRVHPQGQHRLTPLYDVVSIWPVEGNGPNQFSMFKAKMAMNIFEKNKHYQFRISSAGTSTTWPTNVLIGSTQRMSLDGYWSQLQLLSKPCRASFRKVFQIGLRSQFLMD